VARQQLSSTPQAANAVAEDNRLVPAPLLQPGQIVDAIVVLSTRHVAPGMRLPIKANPGTAFERTVRSSLESPEPRAPLFLVFLPVTPLPPGSISMPLAEVRTWSDPADDTGIWMTCVVRGWCTIHSSGLDDADNPVQVTALGGPRPPPTGPLGRRLSLAMGTHIARRQRRKRRRAESPSRRSHAALGRAAGASMTCHGGLHRAGRHGDWAPMAEQFRHLVATKHCRLDLIERARLPLVGPDGVPVLERPDALMTPRQPLTAPLRGDDLPAVLAVVASSFAMKYKLPVSARLPQDVAAQLLTCFRFFDRSLDGDELVVPPGALGPGTMQVDPSGGELHMLATRPSEAADAVAVTTSMQLTFFPRCFWACLQLRAGDAPFVGWRFLHGALVAAVVLGTWAPDESARALGSLPVRERQTAELFGRALLLAIAEGDTPDLTGRLVEGMLGPGHPAAADLRQMITARVAELAAGERGLARARREYGRPGAAAVRDLMAELAAARQPCVFDARLDAGALPGRLAGRVAAMMLRAVAVASDTGVGLTLRRVTQAAEGYRDDSLRARVMGELVKFVSVHLGRGGLAAGSSGDDPGVMVHRAVDLGRLFMTAPGDASPFPEAAAVVVKSLVRVLRRW